MKIKITCSACGAPFEIRVREADFERWNRGSNAQDCFPYLTSGERELLISQTCDSCFDHLFTHKVNDDVSLTIIDPHGLFKRN